MPTKRYALETAGPERLEITWGATVFSRCTVRLDGQVVASFPFTDFQGGKEKEIRLTDGSSLTLKQITGLGVRFRILLNGKPLPASVAAGPDRPQTLVGWVFFLYGVGGIGALVGLGIGLAILLSGIPTDNGAIIGPVVMVLSLLGGALFFLIARGLWRLQNWARLSMIALCSLLLLGGLIFGFSDPNDVASRLGRFVIFMIALAYGIYWFAAHGSEFGPAAQQAEGGKPPAVRDSEQNPSSRNGA